MSIYGAARTTIRSSALCYRNKGSPFPALFDSFREAVIYLRGNIFFRKKVSGAFHSFLIQLRPLFPTPPGKLGYRYCTMDCRQRTFRNLLRAAEVISCSSPLFLLLLLLLLLEPLRTAAGTSLPTPMQRRSSRRILPSVRVRQTLRKQVNQNYDGKKRIRLFSFPPFQLRQLFSCEKIEGVARSLSHGAQEESVRREV